MDTDEIKGRLETAEDSLNQALSEIDSTKKAAYEDGYQLCGADAGYPRSNLGDKLGSMTYQGWGC